MTLKIRVLPSGKLFVRNGKLVLANCCCSGECCTFDPMRRLYITLDNFTCPQCEGFEVISADAGETGSTGMSGGTGLFTWELGDHGNAFVYFEVLCDVLFSDPPGAPPAIWPGVPAGTHWIRSLGQNYWYGNGIENPPTCTFQMCEYVENVNEFWPIGLATCDPFFLQGEVCVEVHEFEFPHAVICTGTMRITITE
jgi:hypothetical protein